MSAAKVIPRPASRAPAQGGAWSVDREITEVRRRGGGAASERQARARLARVVVSPAQVRELPIDPRVAFVLSRIDGQSPLETLVDVTGFETDEVRSILARLVQLGAIAIS